MFCILPVLKVSKWVPGPSGHRQKAGGVEPCNYCICNWLRTGRKVSSRGRKRLTSGQLQDARKGEGVEYGTEAGRQKTPLGQMKCSTCAERENIVTQRETRLSPDLVEVIKSWDKLPEVIKNCILAMIKTSI